MSKRVVLALTVLAVGAVAGVAYATDGGRYNADLQPVGSNPPAHGTASLFVAGRQLTVDIHASGLAPNLPHAMHIHGVLGDPNVCPPPGADTDNDGLISLQEGAPFYGPIDASFTTSGDTSPASGLALARFPVADDAGNLNYNRTFTIPQNVLDSLGSLHVVVHGLALDGNADGPVGGYDTLFEAVLPVACGAIASS